MGPRTGRQYLLVPRPYQPRFDNPRFASGQARRRVLICGTDGSNPVPSSEESANFPFGMATTDFRALSQSRLRVNPDYLAWLLALPLLLPAMVSFPNPQPALNLGRGSGS